MNSGTLYSQMVHSNACMFEKSWFMLWFKMQLLWANSHIKPTLKVGIYGDDEKAKSCSFNLFWSDFHWFFVTVTKLKNTLCDSNCLSSRDYVSARYLLFINIAALSTCLSGPTGHLLLLHEKNIFLRRFLKVLKASLALRWCIACIKLTSIHFLPFLP